MGLRVARIVGPTVVDRWKAIWHDRPARLLMLERLTDWYDRQAGRYRLTPTERWIQTECRWRFGLYDPGSSVQAAFVDQLLGRTIAA